MYLRFLRELINKVYDMRQTEQTQNTLKRSLYVAQTKHHKQTGYYYGKQRDSYE